MKELSENKRVWTKILGERTIHVFSLGFEERCLAYPVELSQANPHGGKQIFRCVRLPDDKVNSSLRERRKKNESSIKSLLPSTLITSLKEIEREIDSADLFDNFCLDISTLPRTSVFRLLEHVIFKSRGSVPIFIIYSYPNTYSSGSLGNPSTEVALHFEEPELTRGEKVAAIMLPGFDRPFTDIALTYMKGATREALESHWQFPFPGWKYAFYERALESHIDLAKGGPFSVYPQDEINLAYELFKKKVKSINHLPIFFAPLGPRISCVPVFLATLFARRRNIMANILIPKTRSYTSTRSEGYQVPLIEEIRQSVLDAIDPDLR